MGVGFMPCRSDQTVCRAGARERLQDVVAVGIEAGDLEQRLDPAVGAAAVEEHDEVDGLDDQVARHGDDGLLDQLLQAHRARPARSWRARW